MKTINKIFILVPVAFVFLTSCADYLDVSSYFEETGTLGAAFKKRLYTEGFFSNAYEVMYDELADITSGGKGGYSMWASDELLRMDGNICKQYQNGEYSANNLLLENDKWKRVYETIRKSSTFLQYVDSCSEMTLNERQEYKAQAYFLRAYAYWILLREYGPVPIMPEYGLDINLSYEEMAVPRNSLDECVDFIANEFLKAARNLPLSWPANNNGRPTCGAALAARARVYLLAASPLFNRDGKEMFDLVDHNGKKLIPQEYDESKWARAAAAALDVMNLENGNRYALYTVPRTANTVIPPAHPEFSDKDFPNGWANIDPFESYRQIFNGSVSASKNKEVIFTRTNDRKHDISHLVGMAMPFTLGGGNAVAVTLKQVKAYYRYDGKTVERAKELGEYEFDLVPENKKNQKRTQSANAYPFVGRQVSLMYVNLEPRFYASIAYPGSIWECTSNSEKAYQNVQIFYYQGWEDSNNQKGNGNEYNNPESFPITGIGLKKYYNPEDGMKDGGSITEKFEPAIRYADVLMWYAEALNELTTTHTMQNWKGEDLVVKREISELKRGMKPIRMRAGLPDFNEDIYADPQSFRSVLKRERQIEFFAECKRFYDLRRWRDAEVQENIPSTGYNVNMPNVTSPADNPQWLRFYEDEVSLSSSYPKYFNKRMYLYPIPQYEITRNKKLTQNPGW